MKNRFIALLLFLILFLAAAAVYGAHTRTKQRQRNPRRYVTGELLVRYKPESRKAVERHMSSTHGIFTIRKFRRTAIDHVKLPENLSVSEALEIYRNDPDVLFAEPNYLRSAHVVTPDDTFFESEQWGLENTGQAVNGVSGLPDADIDASEAWEETTGDGSIIVAVIDSGLDYNHPDLVNNLWVNSGEIPDNHVDDDGNGYVDDTHGWNFLDGDSNIMDSNTHGTGIAGVIAAEGNNGYGTAGVCWNARIMPLKFLDEEGDGSVSDEVEAIEYAIANGARIINASFGDASPPINSEQTAIRAAQSAGILFVASAGNLNENNDVTPLYPASYTEDNIVAVAASTQEDELADFSNYGETSVDVAAPGTNILTPKPYHPLSDDFDDLLIANWTLEQPWRKTEAASKSGTRSITNNPLSDNDAYNGSTARTMTAIDLSNYTDVQLVFYLRRVSSTGNDALHVETAADSQGPWTEQAVTVVLSDNGTTTSYPNGITGIFTTWRLATASPQNLDGEQTAFVRFRMSDNNVETTDGWYIDDFFVSGIQTDRSVGEGVFYHGYQSGTSLAAPFISGLAGLIWSQYPDLTYCQVRQIIVDSGDDLILPDDETRRIASNLRISASGALTEAESPPDLTCGGGSTPTAPSSSGSSGCFIGSMQ